MISSPTQEGVWDRVKTGIAGASAAVKNVKNNIGQLAKGYAPDQKDLSSVEVEKINYLFGLVRPRLMLSLKKVNVDLNSSGDFPLDYDELISKKPDVQVEINKEIVSFINDLSKMLNMRPREVVVFLNTKYPDIYKLLGKLHNIKKLKPAPSNVTPAIPVSPIKYTAMPSMAANVFRHNSSSSKPPIIPSAPSPTSPSPKLPDGVQVSMTFKSTKGNSETGVFIVKNGKWVTSKTKKPVSDKIAALLTKKYVETEKS